MSKENIDLSSGQNFLEKRARKAAKRDSNHKKKKYKKTSAGIEQYAKNKSSASAAAEKNIRHEDTADSIPISEAENEVNSAREIGEVSGSVPLMEDIYDYVTAYYDFMVVDENLYVYKEDQGFWKLIPQNDNYRDLRRLLPRFYMAKVTKTVLSELHEWLVVTSNCVKAEDLRKSRNYINFKNVAYNVKDDSFTAERKDLYFRYSLAIDYCGEEKSSGVFKEFIETALEHDKKTIKEFRKFFALCLSNCRGLRYAFFLYGPSGTSKSTVERVLRHTIGAEHCVSLSFSQLSNDFATASLHGKHLSISGEISDMGNKKLDIFKSITGDDLISSSYKGRDYFTLENRSVLVFATNVLPTISNKAESEAMISRMIIFPFTHVVKRSDSVNEYWMTLMQDVPGIVDFALEGFKDLRDDDFRFYDSPSMESFKNDYAGENDSFGMFAKEMLEPDNENKVASETIEKAYKIYCNIHDYIPLESRQWALLLKRMFACKSVKVSLPGKESRVRGYKGIRLKSKALKMLDNDGSEGTEDSLENVLEEQLQEALDEQN